MKVILALVVLIAVAASVPIFRANDGERVPNSYIVKFHSNTSDDTFAAFVQKMTSVHNLTPTSQWKIGKSFRGVAIAASESEIQGLLSEDGVVDFIEEDKAVNFGETSQGECVEENTLAWGLARISDGKEILPIQDYIYPDHGGEGVHSYIVDTGIRTTHTEFRNGRAIWGANFVDSQNTDCNGHGTHVAGTVGGTLYGVAKKVVVVAVKVLNCQGSGTNVGVINGVDFVASDCAQKRRKCNANMSLGGSKSLALNAAVDAVVETGIPFAVAAGNENRDACLVSPASAEKAVCVGATALGGSGVGENQADYRSSFSNFGPCTTIFAPGSAIPAAWITSDTAFNTISGTSMASPHVAGVMSILQAEHPDYTPEDITNRLVATATADVINLACTTAICRNTQNLLLHSSCTV